MSFEQAIFLQILNLKKEFLAGLIITKATARALRDVK